MEFLLIACVVAGIFFFILYNSLVAKKNAVANVFGSIDALLKKRFDLIPNLIASVQAYMQHEKGVLTEITELRGKALANPNLDQDKLNIDRALSQAIGRVMIAVENYPQLKASDNFLQLQRALNETEEQVSAARRAYNAAITDYNNAVEMFPTNLVASLISYQPKKVFEIPTEERANPNAGDLFKKS